ncbi:MAG TPA: ABC transporter substrate-binding protein [Pseudonocardia sp.]|uniref:ABC transporter substrate-binding protein n=1 Tax=Pseudonocardia sp. TaxID=60912 RepID=UPI002B61EE7D|nr:ABC transporter substrate-binding protein [Pseudonocardia sp.]HTF47649.1 ABC transporter substrate-binding protein [Pseudonocardia sp.]
MLVLDPPAARSAGVTRRSLLRGVGYTAGAALLAACGSERPPAAGAGGITVTDQRGQRVVLDRPATRIVTIVIPAASLFVALDSGVSRLVGVNSSAAQAIREGILGEIFPDASRIPGDVADQSFAPNVESIVGLNPDVVIQWGDRGEEIIAPLRNAGLTVVGLNYGTQADLETWISLFGELIGKPERASLLVARMHQRLDALRTAVAAPGLGPRPKILYFQQMRGGLKIGGHGSYNDFYINLVGGTNSASDLTSQAAVDVEQVVAWDPDIVLVGNFDAATPEQDVYGVPAWQGMSAVRHRRVYKIPLGGYRWDPPCQESPLMWRWLHGIAYPGAGGSSLRAEMRDDYQFLYQHTLTDGQIDQILRTDLNAASADYRQFSV